LSGSRIKDRDYLAVSATVRAREGKMLTREKKERMIDASSYEDAAKMLTECGYEDMSAMNATQIEEALSKHRTRIFYEIEKLVPEREVVDAFRLKYDYHNAKVLVKAEGANIDGEYLMSDSGRVPPKEFAEAYHTRDYRCLSSKLSAALEDARGVLSRTGNSQLADFILDKAYFEELQEMGERLYCPFLAEYTALSADAANLSAVVRTVRMGRDFDFFKKAMVGGGGIDAEKVAMSAISGDGFAQMLKGTPFEQAASAAEEAVKGSKLAAFELSIQKVMTDFLRKSVLTSFGAESVIAYLAAVEDEITAARMILTGKLSGIDSRLLKERLSD